MAYTTTSSFPTSIDERNFISDVDLKHKDVFDTHTTYLANGEYSNASTYINAQSGITPIVADLFKMEQNRLIALQTYLLTLTPIERASYGNEPSSPTNGQIWIE